MKKEKVDLSNHMPKLLIAIVSSVADGKRTVRLPADLSQYKEQLYKHLKHTLHFDMDKFTADEICIAYRASIDRADIRWESSLQRNNSITNFCDRVNRHAPNFAKGKIAFAK